MKTTSVVWTVDAKEDLVEIRSFIAQDSPPAARDFIRRLRKSVDRLKTAPEIGAVVPEARKEYVREILYGNYRIIYSYRQRVEILTVRHGARLLSKDDFDFDS